MILSWSNYAHISFFKQVVLIIYAIDTASCYHNDYFKKSVFMNKGRAVSAMPVNDDIINEIKLFCVFSKL